MNWSDSSWHTSPVKHPARSLDGRAPSALERSRSNGCATTAGGTTARGSSTESNPATGEQHSAPRAVRTRGSQQRSAPRSGRSSRLRFELGAGRQRWSARPSRFEAVVPVPLQEEPRDGDNGHADEGRLALADDDADLVPLEARVPRCSRPQSRPGGPTSGSARGEVDGQECRRKRYDFCIQRNTHAIDVGCPLHPAHPGAQLMNRCFPPAIRDPSCASAATSRASAARSRGVDCDARDRAHRVRTDRAFSATASWRST